MQNALYPTATALFVLLVAALCLLALRGLNAAWRAGGLPPASRRRRLWWAALSLGAWLSYAAVLAGTGILRQFDALPPRLLLILLPPLLLAVALCRRASVGRLLDATPAAGLVYVQAFRILMEIILWLLFRAGLIPVQMTFEGRNWDILVGLSAPVVAYMCFTRRAWPLRVALLWNLAGLALLLNIVVVAVLSVPLPFRVFLNEPANTIVADFPFVWLPAFVVPLAMCCHLLSLRQLQRRGAARPLETAAPLQERAA